jgi:hypothetical protein
MLRSSAVLQTCLDCLVTATWGVCEGTLERLASGTAFSLYKRYIRMQTHIHTQPRPSDSTNTLDERRTPIATGAAFGSSRRAQPTLLRSALQVWLHHRVPRPGPPPLKLHIDSIELYA